MKKLIAVILMMLVTTAACGGKGGTKGKPDSGGGGTSLACEIVGPSASDLDANVNFAVTVNGDKGKLSYDWVLTGSSLVPSSSNDAVLTSYNTEGDFAVEVTVTDKKGQCVATTMVSIVDPNPTSNMTVSWTIPTYRDTAPGEPLQPLSLAEIGSYTIYYGEVPGVYTHYVTVPDGYLEEAIIVDIPLGFYEVVMTTTDTLDQTSRYSIPAPKNVE